MNAFFTVWRHTCNWVRPEEGRFFPSGMGGAMVRTIQFLLLVRFYTKKGEQSVFLGRPGRNFSALKGREGVRNLILGYPSLINKIFGTFLGENHRVNPEILGDTMIPGSPLTTSLWRGRGADGSLGQRDCIQPAPITIACMFIGWRSQKNILMHFLMQYCFMIDYVCFQSVQPIHLSNIRMYFHA